MLPVRILLAELPQLLRDVIRGSVDGHLSVQVVGEVDDDAELQEAVESTGAEAVIVSLRDGGLPQTIKHLVDVSPRLIVAGVSPHGDRAILYRLSPIQMILNDVSPAGLVDAIRLAVRGPEA